MLNQFLTKKMLYGAIIVGIFMIILLAIFQTPQTQREQQGAQQRIDTIQNTSQLHKTEIGKTTDQEVAKMPGVVKQETYKLNGKKYSIERDAKLPYDEVITQNRVVTFERIIVPESPSEPGYVTLEDYTKTYGEPEQTIIGSKRFGEDFATYIYSSKGMALVGNIHNNAIYEVQLFRPMSPQAYVLAYGEDIQPVTSNQRGE